MFYCVKRFGPIIRVENNSQVKFTTLHVPHIGLLCYLDSDEIFFIKKLVRKQGINIHGALQGLCKIGCLNQSKV